MTDPAQRPDYLPDALACAGCGIRVLPIVPHTKRPPMRAWTFAATTDPDTITSWYTGFYAGHGVGLAMGKQPDGRMIFALDVDEHDPAHSGSETLAELVATNGELPDTVRSITGSGGLHLIYSALVEVRNGIAGDGLDVRGEGGQIVVAPTIHPGTGRAYAWETGCAPWEMPIAPAPAWLLDLVLPAAPTVTRSAAPSAPRSPFNRPDADSPAEWLRARWDWPTELVSAGWTLHSTESDGTTHWTRPGKPTRDGSSAVLHVPDGPFNVFSTEAPPAVLRAGQPGSAGLVSLSPFDFYAATHHDGNVHDTGAALRLLMTPAPAPTRPGARRLAAVPPPAPSEGRKVTATPMSGIKLMRARWLWDGRLPMGELALLAGPEGLGKSTLAYWLAAQVTIGALPGEESGRERGVLVCATEDSWEHTVAPRLLAHGADPKRVHRIDVELDGAIHGELSLPVDLVAVRDLAAELDAALMILDPLMSRLDHALDTHRDHQVRQALEPLTEMARSARMACIGLIHHNKSGSTNPNDLIMGSRAFNAVARSVHHVLRDPEDETGATRMFGTTKNNLGKLDLDTLTFKIESWEYDTVDDDGNPDGKGEVGRVVWGANSQSTIMAALHHAGTAGSSNAVDWLREYMKRHGPQVDGGDAIKAADAAGIPRRSLTNARRTLGIDSVDHKGGFGPRRTTWFPVGADPVDRRLADRDPGPSIGDIT